MLSINQVSKSYNKKDLAVDKLSLEVKAGEIFGLLGPNGAGKTTTIKMATGILMPDSGSISINGHDIISDALAAKFDLAYISDDPNLFLRLKGIEYLQFMADIYKVAKNLRKERIASLAKSFEMETALADRILNYSHGMRQKIMLMGALLHNPPLWMLDEPMTGLDPQSAFLLKQMMRRHADAGNSVVFSTHVLEVAEKVCDRVGIIDKGKLLFCGTMEQLKQENRDGRSLESIFLKLVNADETAPVLDA